MHGLGAGELSPDPAPQPWHRSVTIHPVTPPLDPKPPDRTIPALRLVVAGSGRDGTTTVRELVRSLSRLNGEEWVVPNELYCGHICNLTTVHLETGITAYRHALRDLLEHVPAHALVGPAYQFALDLLADLHGPGVRLIHLRRRDRAACIESIARIVRLKPAGAINYSDVECPKDQRDYFQRPAAYHYGEMTRAEWSTLDLRSKIGWYFDKTHALITAAQSHFAATLGVATEELGERATVARIANFIHPGWTQICEPVHLNSTEALLRNDGLESSRDAMLVDPDD